MTDGVAVDDFFDSDDTITEAPSQAPIHGNDVKIRKKTQKNVELVCFSITFN